MDKMDKKPKSKSELDEAATRAENIDAANLNYPTDEQEGGPVDMSAGETGEEPSYESLCLMLEDLRTKADDHHDQLLRTRAEMDNVRRRGEREADKARKYALESFLQELVAVKDSLEMGLSAAQEPGADVAKLREGMTLTDKLLATAMSKAGAKEIDPLDQPFNPEWHQAMSTQESNLKPPNTVVMVFQKGYVLHDRLIRPARVVVSKPVSGGAGA